MYTCISINIIDWTYHVISSVSFVFQWFWLVVQILTFAWSPSGSLFGLSWSFLECWRVLFVYNNDVGCNIDMKPDSPDIIHQMDCSGCLCNDIEKKGVSHEYVKWFLELVKYQGYIYNDMSIFKVCHFLLRLWSGHSRLSLIKSHLQCSEEILHHFGLFNYIIITSQRVK